jgi:hypothetical protein
MFRVGMKVVCVDKSHGFRNILGEWFDDADLIVGDIYTIRWIGHHDGVECIKLVEIPFRRAPRGKRANNTGMETFRATRFRPVVERKTDISVFQAMLNPADAAREMV